MQELSVTVAPSPAAAAAAASAAQESVPKAVTKTVEVPEPASVPLQIVALLFLVGLCGGSIYLLATNDSVGVLVAAPVVLVLASFVLIAWAAIVLNTKIGPAQLLEILKAVLGALKDSKEEEEEEEGEEDEGQPAPA
jgi:hypothetical protein